MNVEVTTGVGKQTHYFCSHIRTFVCSLHVVVLPVVVLAVIYLGYLRN